MIPTTHPTTLHIVGASLSTNKISLFEYRTMRVGYISEKYTQNRHVCLLHPLQRKLWSNNAVFLSEQHISTICKAVTCRLFISHNVIVSNSVTEVGSFMIFQFSIEVEIQVKHQKMKISIVRYGLSLRATTGPLPSTHFFLVSWDVFNDNTTLLSHEKTAEFESKRCISSLGSHGYVLYARAERSRAPCRQPYWAR